ncbi:MAG TPA: tetratricopeptide repeat protein [Pilimelia sp.]|nr:tetratricopeptide repeat protein [Pilimelia sp.]
MAEGAGQLAVGQYDSLEELVTTGGPLPPRRVAAIGLRVLDALRALHGAGVADIDVQPRSILINGDQVRLVDSGPADPPRAQAPPVAAAQASTYAAPERVAGTGATAASELWSLGATLYFAVAGSGPFERANAGADPAPPRHVGALAVVIEGLLRPDPTRRLAVDETSKLLEGVVQSAGTGSDVAVPRQLPAAPPGFVGRTAQLDTMTRLLDEQRPGGGAVAVQAVIGPAGVGKTALAVRWAWQVQDRFPDGQLFVNLRGGDRRGGDAGRPMTAELALDAFLRALGVSGEKIPAAVEARARLYRSLLYGRRVLVVLDNADAADQVAPLLPGLTGCVALVTSRTRLIGGDGTHVVSLGLLAPAEATALVAQVIGASRVDAEPDAAAELARLCAHLPLALHIAAERVAASPDRTLSDLVAELADERTRAAARTAAGDDQAAALRSAISWSYRALPAEGARVFRLLGIHPGPDVSAPAAAALTGTPITRMRPLLEVLCGAHLLERVAPDRYRFHDLLHRYAAERAAEAPEPERTTADRRALTWYLHTADAAVRAFSPLGLRVPLDAPATEVAGEPLTFTDQREALQWCEAERANLVAATRHAAACGEHVVAWKLPAVLWDFFSLRGHWSDWIATHEIGLAAAQHLGDKFGEAWMENNLGNAYRGRGQFEEALRHFHRALAINEETGNRRGEGWTRYNIGDTYRELGRFEEALGQLREALFIGREVGERWTEGYTLNMIGDTYRGLGQFDEALRHLLPALVIHRGLGHLRGEGHALQMIGDTHRERQRFDKAFSYYEQALAVRRKVGDRRGEGLTLHSLGDTYRQCRRYDEASDHYERALAVRHEIGDQRGEARSLSSLGAVRQQTGQVAAARESWHRALAIFDELGDPQVAEIRARLKALG